MRALAGQNPALITASGAGLTGTGATVSASSNYGQKLLPPENQYQAIFIDVLGSNDNVLVAGSVTTPVWVQGDGK